MNSIRTLQHVGYANAIEGGNWRQKLTSDNSWSCRAVHWPLTNRHEWMQPCMRHRALCCSVGYKYPVSLSAATPPMHCSVGCQSGSIATPRRQFWINVLRPLGPCS